MSVGVVGHAGKSSCCIIIIIIINNNIPIYNVEQ